MVCYACAIIYFFFFSKSGVNNWNVNETRYTRSNGPMLLTCDLLSKLISNGLRGYIFQNLLLAWIFSCINKNAFLSRRRTVVWTIYTSHIDHFTPKHTTFEQFAACLSVFLELLATDWKFACIKCSYYSFKGVNNKGALISLCGCARWSGALLLCMQTKSGFLVTRAIYMPSNMYNNCWQIYNGYNHFRNAIK